MTSLGAFEYIFSMFHPANPYKDAVDVLRHDLAVWNEALSFHDANLKELQNLRSRSKLSSVMIKVATIHGDTQVRRRSKKPQLEFHTLTSCPNCEFSDPLAQFGAELRAFQEATYRIASINTTLSYIDLSRKGTDPKDSALTRLILEAMLKDVSAFPPPPSRPFMLATPRPDDLEAIGRPTRMIFDEPQLSQTIAGLDAASRKYLEDVAVKVRRNGPVLPAFLSRRTPGPVKDA